MCCGWTRSFWLLLNEVSANTICMPTSPYPSSKLFFEVLHTNWEKIESLSVKNCWVALNFRNKTPPPCAKEEQYDLFHDCIHSNAWSLVQANWQEQAGSRGCPAANPPPPSYPFLRAGQETDARLSTSASLAYASCVGSSICYRNLYCQNVKV